MIPENPFVLVLGLLTIVLGAGRLTRVITYDAYPPAVWLREQWVDLVRGGDWARLFTCFWCMSPWVTAAAIVHGTLAYGTFLEWTFWAFWGWLALSYAAALVLARDEPQA